MQTKPLSNQGKPRPEPKSPPGPIAAAAAFLILAGTIGTVAFAATDGPPAEIAEAEAAAFAEADANDDGFLTEAELATFHTLMRAKIEALRFDRVDSDDDGLVTLEELQAARPGGPPGGGPGGHGGGAARRGGAAFSVPVP
jgi:hypothetical protein